MVDAYLTDYPIITGSTVTVAVSYVLNPCTDSLLNSITVPADNTVVYTIEDPMTYVNMPASSFTSALSGCGSVATTVTESSTSITYNAGTEQLEIVSNDAALAGTSETILVDSHLVDWPTITGATVTVSVSYVLNPCVDILQNLIIVPIDES